MFRRRSRRPAADLAPASPAAPERCAASACRRQDATRCEYVDKRSRTCPTSWCPGHAVIAIGRSYCRRHAATMAALEGAEVVAGLPDLDNRAPSLVGWVGRELDGPIHELFARIAPSRDVTVVTDPVRLVLLPGGNSRRWAKTWKMLDQASIINRVSVEVDERDDRCVLARVDTELIGQGVPPWIQNRLAGKETDPATAAAERHEFAMAMARSIELVVTRQEVLPRY